MCKLKNIICLKKIQKYEIVELLKNSIILTLLSGWDEKE